MFMCGPSIQCMVRYWALGRSFGTVLLILLSSQCFIPQGILWMPGIYCCQCLPVLTCSHQYKTILFVMPYLSGLKSDLFLVYWMTGLCWQVFSLSVSSWEYGDKSVPFIPWLHFKSKLSLENVFWFSHLFTEIHWLNFTGWNFRNDNPRKLITSWRLLPKEQREQKGHWLFDNCTRISERCSLIPWVEAAQQSRL